MDKLTPRQREVLALKAKGLTARDIAARLCVSPHTVYSHLRDARTYSNKSTIELAISVSRQVQ